MNLCAPPPSGQELATLLCIYSLTIPEVLPQFYATIITQEPKFPSFFFLYGGGKGNSATIFSSNISFLHPIKEMVAWNYHLRLWKSKRFRSISQADYKKSDFHHRKLYETHLQLSPTADDEINFSFFFKLTRWLK